MGNGGSRFSVQTAEPKFSREEGGERRGKPPSIHLPAGEQAQGGVVKQGLEAGLVSVKGKNDPKDNHAAKRFMYQTLWLVRG